MKFAKAPFQQYFLAQAQEVGALLDSIDFGRRTIIEIGVGGGALTDLIARNVGHGRIIGYEIDSSVVPSKLFDSIDLRLGDVLQADLSYINECDYALVCNPPYALIPWILERFAAALPALPIVIQVPGGMAVPAGFEKRLIIPGCGFQPPTPRAHAVYTRGVIAKGA